ncbi:hypothetical protein Tsumi_07770 [Porphyromonas miyakawae]|uniref:Small ribosomal subunit protein bS16 n=1 Tax=Porphyromonas miyakawae TaxID=3137470 RepID=A0ABQ0E1U6_9PORP
MATKIRLQRHGRKGYPFYQIVVADSRAPRDGKFIERIGTYNPNTNPATVDLKFDRALYWLTVGAQPTDTARNILSREGVLLKKHLLGGVRKGAFDEAVAEQRFEAWKEKRQQRLDTVRSKDEAAKREEEKKRLAAEEEINRKNEELIAERKRAEEKAKEEEEAAKRAAEAEALSAEVAPAEEPAAAPEAEATEATEA